MNRQAGEDAAAMGAGEASRLDPESAVDYWEAAERVCTPKELEALILWSRGAGYGRIAGMLDLSPSTARDRVKRALRKLLPHLPETEETT